jgi:polyisoprenoid-binding protein YceI
MNMSVKLLSSLLALLSVGAILSGPSTPPAAAPTAGLSVDSGHSSCVFRVMHMDTAYFYGRFNKISGDVVLEEKNGSVTIEIDADSIDTNSAPRDGHLKGQDFFSVKEFPKITFKSKTVAKKGEEWEVAGDLSMHGVTKPLTVIVKPSGSSNDPRMGPKSGFETEFTVKRSDFGMTYGVEKKALGDDVKVMLSVEAGGKK